LEQNVSMKTEWQAGLSAELEQSLEEAVKRLRAKVDAVYCETCESEKMADLHYLAQELVDQEMEAVVAGEAEPEAAALLELRERVRRHVHRLIEATRRAV
jgi:hypothetical protein